MKAVVLKIFRDLEEEVLREPGQIFEVTQERLDAINSTSCGLLAVQAILPNEKQDDSEEESKVEAEEEPKEKTAGRPKKGNK